MFFLQTLYFLKRRSMDGLKPARPCLRAVSIPLNGCLHWVVNVFFAPPLTLVFRRYLLHLFSSSFPLSNLLTHERAAIILLGVLFRRSITTHPSPLRPYAFNYIPTHSGIPAPFHVGQMSRVVAYIVISVNV